MKKRNTELTADSAATAFPHDPEPGQEESPSPSPTNDASDCPAADAAPSAPAEQAEGPASLEVAPDTPAPVPEGVSMSLLPDPEAPSSEFAHDELPQMMLKPLERRISRLEEALAQLQDLNQKTPVPQAPAAQAVFVPMAKIAPPPTPTLNPPPAASSVERAQLQPAPTPAGPANRSLWLLFDIVAEGRAILRMFVDPRYKMSWLGRIVPILLILAYFFWPWWPMLAPLSNTFMSKPIDLVICFVLFKILSYEARRYRETAPDLPASLKL